jgi:L-threonylcarbamoyladenylate synthase
MIERQVELAIEILKKGGVIIFPTDTVYGIGASPFIESAVLRVYQIKQRPRHSALPLLVARKSDLNQVANPIS